MTRRRGFLDNMNANKNFSIFEDEFTSCIIELMLFTLRSIQTQCFGRFGDFVGKTSSSFEMLLKSFEI